MKFCGGPKARASEKQTDEIWLTLDTNLQNRWVLKVASPIINSHNKFSYLPIFHLLLTLVILNKEDN